MMTVLEQLLENGGVILLLILLAGLFVYWQLADLVFDRPCPKSKNCWQCRNSRCQQLMVWISAVPLLGLLGTVNGLLNGFAVMGSSGSELLAQNISQALLTTQAGLMVAAPAWLVLALIQHNCRMQLEQVQ